MSPERFENYLIWPIPEATAPEHNQVDPGEQGLACPKALPDQALNPVPIHGHTDILFGDRKTQARPAPVVWSCQDREQGITSLSGISKDPLEFGCC